jgi:hypothetical protein
VRARGGPPAQLALAVIALALGGCGGGDSEGDAARVVREYFTAANERDADKYCDELVTDAFLQQTTLATGDGARRECREQLKTVKRPRIEVVDIKRTEIQDDRASVIAELSVGVERREQTFELVKEGGEFRLNSALAER